MSTKRHSNVLMVLFSVVLGVALIWIFYASPLRARVENKLFDIRTRLAPNFETVEHAAIVAIDDRGIAELEAEAAGADGPAKDLSVAGLLRVVKAALAQKPRLVAVVIPPQVFDYDDPALAELTALAAADRRVLLGTIDLTLKRRDPEGLPAAFRAALPQLAKADVVREFKREIVRSLRVAEDGELPYLPYAAAERMDPVSVRRLEASRADGVIQLRLNYLHPDAIPRVRAEDLVKGDGAAVLAGRAVFVGYTAYRPLSVHAPEATFVNGPWQSDGAGLEEGFPVVVLHAIALENILHATDLREAPLAANVAQTAVLAGATLAIWALSVGFASFLFIGGWSLVLLLHAPLFAFANLYVPLADAMLISGLVMMSGALWRLRVEGRLRAAQQAKASSQAELARVQDRFLNRFSVELAAINRKIKAALEPHRELKDLGGTAATAYVRALGSSEELEDYLQGIHQFAGLPGPGATKPRLVAVDLADVTDKVLRQFESRKRELRVRTRVEAQGPCHALAEPMLVGQILYNLVSNAIKYSPPDRTVTVTLTTDGDAARVVVKDDGPGIPQEFQERIFEKFYRVKDDHVYKLKGHGLGLYLSRYFAGEIGAELTVASRAGEGAAFALTLKRAKEPS